LPGGERFWPEKVTDSVDGRAPVPLPVVSPKTPQVFLAPGRHVVKGQWSWSELPDTLIIPLGLIVTVTVNGQEKIFPYQEPHNQNSVAYWLKDAQKPGVNQPKSASEAQTEADHLDYSIDRLIIDDQPMSVVARIRLTVSGRDREEIIDPILLPGSLPTKIVSPLPTRLANRGLRVQVRPGVHDIFLSARLTGQVEKLGPVRGPHGAENWAVKLNPTLRQVNVSGAPQIDASQLSLPWKGLPIYALQTDESLTLRTLRRGDPEPGPNQLFLNRICWLDYDGQGLSCRDQLNGLMRRDWRLSADPPLVLGQANVNGQPQVLTWQINSQGQKCPGFQTRQGRVAVTADLRLENFDAALPASGWDHHLQSAAQTLHLPPGYKLLHVQGARAANDQGRPISWLDRWNTLDLFIVLAIFLAALKLKGQLFALLALVTIVLSYHEFMSPRLVILHIMGAVALLKVLPPGVARSLVKVWYGLAALFLLLTTIVFLIFQLRIAIYPQLEDTRAYQPGSFGYPMSEALRQKPWSSSGQERAIQDFSAPDGLGAGAREAFQPLAETEAEPPSQGRRRSGAQDNASKSFRASLSKEPLAAPSQPPAANVANQSSLARPNPEAIVQNSLARPNWSWQAVSLDFNAQVARDQKVQIYLLRPKTQLTLGLARTLLMALLALKLLTLSRGLQPPRKPKASQNSASSASEPSPIGASSNAAPLAGPAGALGIILALALSLALSLGLATAAQAQSWPSENLLKQFQERLLAPSPQELPPSFSRLAIEIQAETLKMTGFVEALTRSAIQLPNLDANIFQPLSLVNSDGQQLPTFMEAADRAFALVPAGINTFIYQGRLKKIDSFQIRFPEGFKPHKIQLIGDDWVVSGLDRQGFPVSQALFLTRKTSLGAEPSEKVKDAPDSQLAEPVDLVLEPFFHVQRVISLGLEWKVINTIELSTPVKRPVSLKLPLLPGESPLSTQYQAQNGLVVLNFSPRDQKITFESNLKLDLQKPLVLEAQTGPYAETWVLDPSTLWRVEPEGLPPVVNVTAQGFWNPQWRPWPGEKLTIKITKPEPAPGAYLVVDEAQASVTLGERNRKVDLSFRLRSSKGGQHSFRLPIGSEIQTLSVNGQSLPISSAQDGQGPLVNFPINPGEGQVQVSWLSPEPITTVTHAPKVDIGLPTANIVLKISAPQDRFVLLAGGPTQGPAVLFWSLAGALLILSIFLGRAKLTPLGPISWFLLFLGLTQLSLTAGAIVALWLLLLGLRGRREPIKSAGLFNLAQIGLTIWTIMALSLIYQGLKRGLLEAPSMSVTGNGSVDTLLIWFQDRSEGLLPSAWCVTISNSIYHYIMLAWALWLAISIIRWLVWGWKCFSTQTLWKSSPSSPRERPRKLKLKTSPDKTNQPAATKGPNSPSELANSETTSLDSAHAEPSDSEPTNSEPNKEDAS
jgi:hypothetical protein